MVMPGQQTLPFKPVRLGDAEAKPVQKTTSPPIQLGEISYRWSKNSCAFDTTLHLLRITAERDPEGFDHCMGSLPKKGPGLQKVVKCFADQKRLVEEGNMEKLRKTLAKQRDDLRTMVKKMNIIKDIHKPQSLLVRYFGSHLC